MLNSNTQTQLTCIDYYDTYLSTYIDEIIQEQYWDGGVDTNALYEGMLEHAKDKGIKLTDEDTFDYDKFFYNVYQCSEKGLS